MLVKFANIVALGFAVLNLQQAIASPVAETETHDIARRTKSLKCGWAKSKGKDLGCLCDDAASKLDLDFDLGDVLSLLFTKPSKNYPPGCRPNCDGNGGYDCPNGKDNKGNCKDDHGCDGGSAWDNGKCCPAGTRNMGGTCCPTGCEVRGGKCHIPEPPKEDKCTGAHEEKEKKDGKCVCKYGFKREHDKAPCEKICKADDQKFNGHECECVNAHQELVNKVCKDKCIPPKMRNAAGHCELTCPADAKPNEKGDMCECKDPSKKLVGTHCEDRCPGEGQKWNGHECECTDKSKKLVNGHCEPRCGDGQKWNGHECECTDKSKKLVNGHCEPRCPVEGQKWNGHECECTDKSKKLVNGHCEPLCPVPGTKFEHNKCVCEDDQKVLVDKHCEPRCPGAGQKWNGHECICVDPSKKLVNKHCEDRCTGGQKWNGHECVCKGDKKFNKHTGMCECPKGFKPAHEDMCIIECTDGKTPDATGKKCECKHPKIIDGHGKCVDVPKCTHPFELKNNKCECKDGYKEEHGKCVIKCKGDLMPNDKGDMCVCPHGKVPKEHNPNQCVDPAPVCTHPEKLGPNGKKCVCEDGFKRRNGKCEKECGSGNKWCKTKCCRDDQEEDEHGNCKCPHGKKEVEFWGKKSCQKDLLGKLLG